VASGALRAQGTGVQLASISAAPDRRIGRSQRLLVDFAGSQNAAVGVRLDDRRKDDRLGYEITVRSSPVAGSPQSLDLVVTVSRVEDVALAGSNKAQEWQSEPIRWTRSIGDPAKAEFEVKCLPDGRLGLQLKSPQARSQPLFQSAMVVDNGVSEGQVSMVCVPADAAQPVQAAITDLGYDSIIESKTEVTDYEYDRGDRLERFTRTTTLAGSQSSITSAITHDASGRMILARFSDQEHQFAYDPFSRLTQSGDGFVSQFYEPMPGGPQYISRTDAQDNKRLFSYSGLRMDASWPASGAADGAGSQHYLMDLGGMPLLRVTGKGGGASVLDVYTRDGLHNLDGLVYGPDADADRQTAGVDGRAVYDAYGQVIGSQNDAAGFAETTGNGVPVGYGPKGYYGEKGGYFSNGHRLMFPELMTWNTLDPIGAGDAWRGVPPDGTGQSDTSGEDWVWNNPPGEWRWDGQFGGVPFTEAEANEAGFTRPDQSPRDMAIVPDNHGVFRIGLETPYRQAAFVGAVELAVAQMTNGRFRSDLDVDASNVIERLKEARTTLGKEAEGIISDNMDFLGDLRGFLTEARRSIDEQQEGAARACAARQLREEGMQSGLGAGLDAQVLGTLFEFGCTPQGVTRAAGRLTFAGGRAALEGGRALVAGGEAAILEGKAIAAATIRTARFAGFFPSISGSLAPAGTRFTAGGLGMLQGPYEAMVRRAIARKATKSAGFPKWNIGDSITKMTVEGQYPEWKIIRSRYWQNRAALGGNEFAAQNSALMSQGLAPRARVIVRNRNTGLIEERLVSKDLHHAKGNRGVQGFDEPIELREVWPWEHENLLPPGRRLDYDFLMFKP